MKRKIIQITATATNDTEDCYREDRVYALCDDGNIYISFSNAGIKFNDWKLLSSVPQDE